jgi:hypothetical protein
MKRQAERRDSRTGTGPATASSRPGTGRGKPGDEHRDGLGTTGPRWTSGTSAPGPSPVAHRTSSPNGSPEAPHSEAVEPSVEEGFPHIHRPYYCY